jgi:Tfp pilus assembly protein PilF
MTTEPLDLLSRTESVQLLQQFGPPLSGEEAAADAAAIAEALGDLPLALHLAGSYLAYYEGAASPQAFLAELDTAGPFHEALAGEFEGHSPTAHERDVARTFALGYGKLAEGDALTHRILINLAHLAPGEPVPIELLRATLREAGKRPSDKEIMNARQRLVSLGLVTVQSNHTLQIHRLLHHFVRRVIDPEDFEAALAAVETGVINETKRLNEAGKPAALLNWQNHLRHVTNDALPRQDERSAELAKNLGYHLQQVAHYDGAKSYIELALAINEKVLAPDHPDTALILNNLGKLMRDMGHLQSAKTHLERAATIHEQTLGPDHPDTAMSLGALGRVLQIIGDELDRAKSYHERALAIQEQKLGPTHLQTTISLNNLGGLLIDMNDRETARDYFERALAIREETLGPDHPRTAQSLNNLGYLLQIMGDYDNARPYLERALDIHEQALGPEHPKTATSLNNMGELLKEMGELAEARSYFERALANWEQTVGPDHPHTAHCLNNLGEVFQKMGQPAQARPYYERALAILQEKWGTGHAKTRIVQRNLGSLAA